MLSFMETSLGKKVRVSQGSLNDEVAILVGVLRTTFSDSLPSLLLLIEEQERGRELIVNFDNVYSVESVERAPARPAFAKSAPRTLLEALTGLKNTTIIVHSVAGCSTEGKFLGYLESHGCFLLGLEPYQGKAPPMQINWKQVYYIEAAKNTNPPSRVKSARTRDDGDPGSHGTGVGAKLDPPDDPDHALASIGAPHEDEEQRRQKP